MNFLTAFTQETAQAAHANWWAVTDLLRPRFDRLASLMDKASTTRSLTLERPNGKIKRRTDIFANEEAIVRLVGALLLEQNDESAVTRRYMTLETLDGVSDDSAARPQHRCSLIRS